MAHEMETMFYTAREKPWHGLGVEVQEALTSREALVASGLDWQVVQHPLYANGILVDGFVANVRETDGKCLGVVTPRYQIVQNPDAFDFSDRLVGDGVTYDTAGSLHGGKKIWLLAKMPEKKILDDKFEPYLVFTNTHDGSGAIKCAITPIRVVCQNTLNVALNCASRTWSTKHIGNMEDKLIEAQNTLELAEDYMEKLGVEAEILANEKIYEEQLDLFVKSLFPYPSDDVNTRKAENITILRQQFYKAYDAIDIKQYRDTKYGVINAVSDMVTHSKPLRSSPNFKENLFDKIVGGHDIIDKAYKLLKVA